MESLSERNKRRNKEREILKQERLVAQLFEEKKAALAEWMKDKDNEEKVKRYNSLQFRYLLEASKLQEMRLEVK